MPHRAASPAGRQGASRIRRRKSPIRCSPTAVSTTASNTLSAGTITISTRLSWRSASTAASLSNRRSSRFGWDRSADRSRRRPLRRYARSSRSRRDLRPHAARRSRCPRAPGLLIATSTPFGRTWSREDRRRRRQQLGTAADGHHSRRSVRALRGCSARPKHHEQTDAACDAGSPLNTSSATPRSATPPIDRIRPNRPLRLSTQTGDSQALDTRAAQAGECADVSANPFEQRGDHDADAVRPATRPVVRPSDEHGQLAKRHEIDQSGRRSESRMGSTQGRRKDAVLGQPQKQRLRVRRDSDRRRDTGTRSCLRRGSNRRETRELGRPPNIATAVTGALDHKSRS